MSTTAGLATDLGAALLEFALRTAEPLQAAAASPQAALALIELSGWDLGVVAGLGPGELAGACQAAADAVNGVRQLVDAAAAGFEVTDLIEAGATRVGASAGVQILREGASAAGNGY